MNNTISDKQLPYEKLALLGIDRKKADALPEDVRRKLVNGEVTPLLQVSITTRNGNTVTLPLKLQMATDKYGNAMLMAYPVKKEMSEQFSLSVAERERLAKGDVIQKAINEEGVKSQQYLQLDPETLSIIHRRIAEVKIEQKLKDMEKVNDIELGTQQKQQAREGKPVELNVGGEKVSVGVDLKEPQGFKVVKGDLKEWERQQKLRYDVQHPEYIGLVQTEKNRWEYQQVVDRQSTERAIRLTTSNERKESRGHKI